MVVRVLYLHGPHSSPLFGIDQIVGAMLFCRRPVRIDSGIERSQSYPALASASIDAADSIYAGCVHRQECRALSLCAGRLHGAGKHIVGRHGR